MYDTQPWLRLKPAGLGFFQALKKAKKLVAAGLLSPSSFTAADVTLQSYSGNCLAK